MLYDSEKEFNAPEIKYTLETKGDVGTAAKILSPMSPVSQFYFYFPLFMRLFAVDPQWRQDMCLLLCLSACKRDDISP